MNCLRSHSKGEAHCNHRGQGPQIVNEVLFPLIHTEVEAVMSQVVWTGQGYKRILKTSGEGHCDGSRGDSERLLAGWSWIHRSDRASWEEKEGKEARKEMKWIFLEHLPCTECFSMCYFFESPQQNSEAPLRDTRCTVKVTEDHTRQGRAASPSMCTIPLIRV